MRQAEELRKNEILGQQNSVTTTHPKKKATGATNTNNRKSKKQSSSHKHHSDNHNNTDTDDDGAVFFASLLEQEESRLAELEALASNNDLLQQNRMVRQQLGSQHASTHTNTQQAQGFGDGFDGGLGENSMMSMSMVSNMSMSMSEADFMARHIQKGTYDYNSDDNNDAVATQVTAHTQKQSRGQLQTQTNSADKVTAALRDRIHTLEKTVHTLTSNVKRKDEELLKLDEKLKRTAMDLDITRKNANKQLQQTHEDHQRELLKLKQQHAQEMSFIATSGLQEQQQQQASAHSPAHSPKHTNKHTNTASAAHPTHAHPSSNDVAYEQNKNLITQLENIQRDHRNLIHTYAEDKRNLVVEHTTKLIAQERALKSEIVSLKATITELEDNLAAREEEVAISKAKVDATLNLNKALEKARNDAIEQQHRLRADLKNMQASVNTSFKLESAQNMTTGVDTETALRLADAKSEAKIRQLMNKCDFLKAQLDTESTANEDLKRSVDLAKQKYDDLRVEFNLRMHEAEASKRQAIADTEAKMETFYEERMMELTTLQSKLLFVQNQLSEVYQVCWHVFATVCVCVCLCCLPVCVII
jgi:hypothetical protein